MQAHQKVGLCCRCFSMNYRDDLCKCFLCAKLFRAVFYRNIPYYSFFFMKVVLRHLPACSKLIKRVNFLILGIMESGRNVNIFKVLLRLLSNQSCRASTPLTIRLKFWPENSIFNCLARVTVYKLFFGYIDLDLYTTTWYQDLCIAAYSCRVVSLVAKRLKT